MRSYGANFIGQLPTPNSGASTNSFCPLSPLPISVRGFFLSRFLSQCRSSKTALRREQFLHAPLIVCREAQGCVYIRALHAVLVAVQGLDIDREFRSHPGAGNAGLFSNFHQIICHAALPCPTDLSEDAEGVAIRIHGNRRIVRIQRNQKRAVRTVL